MIVVQSTLAFNSTLKFTAKTTMQTKVLLALAATAAQSYALAGELSGTTSYREQLASPTGNILDDALNLMDSGNVMNGIVSFAADAATDAVTATFKDCVTGANFQVAQEGDYPTLEKANFADRASAGVPLHVLFDGSLTERPNTEGSVVVVDRFTRTRPELPCPRQGTDPALEGISWRLDTLDGIAFPIQGEPNLVFEGLQSGSYRATVGCNMTLGAYTIDGNTLAFLNAASTMKHCHDERQTFEWRFREMLGNVTRYAVEGDKLVLQNAMGDPLAVFSAIDF